MLFNSAIFLFAFLPITLFGWYGLNRFGLNRAALCFLSVASLVFYGYFKPSYLILIIGSIIVNFALMKAITKFRKAAGVLLFFGLSANIVLIGIFKYLDFIISIANDTLHTDQSFFNILLPLGISFYTLQQIAGLVDAYRGNTKDYSFIEYLAFVTFFPQLVAGPIVLSDELIPRFRDKNNRIFNYEKFALGLCRFITGLSKKVLIADLFGHIVDFGFEKVYWIDTASAWIVAVCYSVQLYFDFSGYSDMACGLAGMFGFTLPENFDSPYKAVSIGDFWKRWHMTLTRFFTRYLYIPLGGNRNGKIRTCINILIVFLISGLWHGAAWTFVIWGAMHGLAMIWDRRSFFRIKYKWLSGFFTRAFVVVAFMIFRSDNLDFMVRMLKAMFVYNGISFVPELASCLSDLPEFYILTRAVETMAPGIINVLYIVLLTVLLIAVAVIIQRKNAYTICTKIKSKNYPIGYAIYLAALLGMVVVSLNQVSTFLYFNF